MICDNCFLQQALDLAVREFQDSSDLAALTGGSTRSIQWNGLRYMLAEVWGHNKLEGFYLTGEMISNTVNVYYT